MLQSARIMFEMIDVCIFNAIADDFFYLRHLCQNFQQFYVEIHDCFEFLTISRPLFFEKKMLQSTEVMFEIIVVYIFKTIADVFFYIMHLCQNYHRFNVEIHNFSKFSILLRPHIFGNNAAIDLTNVSQVR